MIFHYSSILPHEKKTIETLSGVGSKPLRARILYFLP
jgi:hypothetical protein